MLAKSGPKIAVDDAGDTDGRHGAGTQEAHVRWSMSSVADRWKKGQYTRSQAMKEGLRERGWMSKGALQVFCSLHLALRRVVSAQRGVV